MRLAVRVWRGVSGLEKERLWWVTKIRGKAGRGRWDREFRADVGRTITVGGLSLMPTMWANECLHFLELFD